LPGGRGLIEDGGWMSGWWMDVLVLLEVGAGVVGRG